MALQDPLEETLGKLEQVGQRAGMALAQSNAESAVMSGQNPSDKLPITPAALAYNAAAHEAYAVRTETQIKAKVAELSGQFTGRDPKDPENYAKVFDSFAGSLAGAVPEQMRGRVQSEIMARRAEALAGITHRANEYQFQLHASEIKNGIESDVSEAATRARLLHHEAIPAELLGRAFERIDKGAAMGLWTPDEAAMQKTEAVHAVQAENIFGTATANGTLDSTYAGIVSGKIAPELPVKFRDRLASQLSAEIGHRNAAQAHARAAAESGVRANTYIAKSLVEANKVGAILTPEQRDLQERMLHGGVQIDPDVFDDLRVAAMVPHIGAAVTSLPLADAEAYVQGFRPPTSVDPSAYDTKLDPEEEKAFQVWRAANVNPRDSGEDYDFRGAWKAKEVSAINPADGLPHWSDRFKKPNHPTFSTESVYAKDRPDLAGTWDGENYKPNPKRVFDVAQAKVWDLAQDAVKKQRALLTGNDPIQGLADLGRLSDPGQPGVPPMAFDTPQNFVATLNDRVRRVSRAEEQFRQPFPLFTQAEVSQMRARLDELGPTERVTALAAIMQTASEDQANATLRQLYKRRATHYAIIGETVRSVGTEVAKDIAIGGSLDRKIKGGLLKAEGSPDSTMKDFDAAAGDLFRDSPEERSRWFSATRDLYAARAFRSGEGYTSAGFKAAAADALGGIKEVTTNGPFFYGGQTSKLPGAKGVDYQARIDSLTGSDIEAMGGTNLGLSADEVAKLIRETGGFTYHRDGSLGVTVQLSGGMVTLAKPDGQSPFRLKF